MQRLRDAVEGIDGFDKIPHADKLRLFAWALHAQGKQSVKAADFAACYDVLHLQQPASLHRSVQALHEQGDLLKAGGGFKLAKAVRDRHDAKHGARPISVQVHQALASLLGKVIDPAQKEYLDEAIRCFRGESWRAAAIMAWNLAFDHLCHVILAGKQTEFADAYAKQFHPRKAIAFQQRSDFQEVKETNVIEVARTVGVTDKTQHGVLERNLDVRNSIAHPSAFAFKQPQSENFILEVVQTVVLGLKP